MSLKRLDILVYALIFSALGAAGGFVAARQGAGASDADDDHGEAAGVAIGFSTQTLRNLGVTTGRTELTDFTKYRSIPAVIERTPFNEQPVFAPIGGRILDIRVQPGIVVSSGATLITMVRDPIGRPKLTLTEGVIKPAREEIHEAVVELRRTRAELEILDTEMDRVNKFTGNVGGDDLPILPRQTIIDLQYNVLRTQKALDQSRLELTKHGFTDEQIESIAEGNAIPNLGQDNWMRALIANGLWTESARRLFDALPEQLQKERWTIATVGELAAAGLVRPELVSWLESLGDGLTNFLEIGSLLQQGYSVADLRILQGMNALDPIVQVKAPMSAGVLDWDIERLHVKPGARVAAGDQLLTLLNPREMYLRTNPVGAEKADILRSLAIGSTCEARPLVGDSGPELTDLTIDFITSDPGSTGTSAYARVMNEEITTKTRVDGARYRSWQLRSGLKYLIRIPMKVFERVVVVPSDAIAEDGAKRVVFLPDGDTFRPIEVEIAYQDDRVAVIALNEATKIVPGDVIVTHGAYALGLALRSNTTAVDPHAGHNH
ncbi:MAG: hypothetical protein KDB53_21090 [Planctomycetes bacterium]|nr:hypothetical protein [Planctomycetota bacterium]